MARRYAAVVVAVVLFVTVGTASLAGAYDRPAETVQRWGDAIERAQPAQTLRVTAAPGAEVFDYRIRVDGEARLGDAADPDTGDSITRHSDGTVTIQGTAGAGGVDTYRIVGDVLCGSLDGPGQVSVDGTPVRLGACDAGQPERRTLRVTAAGDASVFQYRIRVDGDAVLGEAADPDTGDSITRNPDGTVTVRGTAGAGGTDSYRIVGDVLCGSLDGPGQVSVDGVPLRLEPCVSLPPDPGDGFDPEVTALFCHELAIAADDASDRFDRVTLFMHDGAVITFTGDFPREDLDLMVFGFRGDRGITWMVADGSFPAETYDRFHGPIRRVEVSNGRTTRTFRNDVGGCVDAVTFGDGGTEVTVSVVDRGEKAVLLRFADGRRLIPDYDRPSDSVPIRGSRTFDAGNRVIESVAIGDTRSEAEHQFDLVVSNVDSDDDGPGGGDARDSDGDGLSDDRESRLGTDPDRKDTDGDRYWDGDEVRSGTDPTDPFDYPHRDSDGDKYTDRDEVEHGTDAHDPDDFPARQDSDGDKLTDGRERAIGTDPLLKDTDGDRYWDGDEWRSGTDPTDPFDYPIRDSDGDGYTDKEELEAGTDPHDPDDHP